LANARGVRSLLYKIDELWLFPRNE
jgi:hypothetical protein